MVSRIVISVFYLLLSFVPLASALAGKQQIMLEQAIEDYTDKAPEQSSSLTSMKFTIKRATNPKERLYPGTYIFGTGIITNKTSDEFLSLLQQNHIHGGVFYLDSTGGNVLDAITLGERTRAFHLDTHIGSYIPQENGTIVTGKGVCLKACVLAFLGGRYRFAKTGEIGVARFFFPPENVSKTDNASLAQALTALTSMYVHKMKVNEEFMATFIGANADTITFPDQKTLERLEIVKEPPPRPIWAFKMISHEPTYLAGVHYTLAGQNKILLTCTPDGQFIMQFLFDARGKKREDYATMTATLHTERGAIVIDRKTNPLPMVNNNFVILPFFVLDHKTGHDGPEAMAQLDQILNSDTISLTLHSSQPDATMTAIDSFDMASGRNMTESYLRSCGGFIGGDEEDH